MGGKCESHEFGEFNQLIISEIRKIRLICIKDSEATVCHVLIVCEVVTLASVSSFTHLSLLVYSCMYESFVPFSLKNTHSKRHRAHFLPKTFADSKIMRTFVADQLAHVGWRVNILAKGRYYDVYLRPSNLASLTRLRRYGNGNVHVGYIIPVHCIREEAMCDDV